MLMGPWRYKKYCFSLGMCAVVGFCCKMAPQRLPEVASHRFLAVGDQIKSEISGKKYLFLVAARTLTLWVRSMLGARWRDKKDTFSLGRCAIVGFSSKMAPLRLPKVASNRFLAFGDKIKCAKPKILFIPRCYPYSDSVR